MEKLDVYEVVTNNIINALEKGTAPWIKPWNGHSNVNHNLVTKKAYQGINALILSFSPYQSNVWATFNQWREKGANVKKGEKGTQIVFFSPIEKETIKDGEKVKDKFFILKTFYIFNYEQIEGYTITETEKAEFNTNENAEKTVLKHGANIVHGKDKACYIPSMDMVYMPNKDSFINGSNYYSTLFHELAHWTGSKDRLNRDLSGSFGSESYAFEELIAELSSAFLCNLHGIQGNLQHESYIASWLKALKNDKKFIFKASAKAQKVVDYVMA